MTETSHIDDSVINVTTDDDYGQTDLPYDDFLISHESCSRPESLTTQERETPQQTSLKSNTSDKSNPKSESHISDANELPSNDVEVPETPERDIKEVC